MDLEKKYSCIEVEDFYLKFVPNGEILVLVQFIVCKNVNSNKGVIKMFPKNLTYLTPLYAHMCVSGVRNISFSEKFCIRTRSMTPKFMLEKTLI